MSGLFAFGLLILACLGCVTRRLSVWAALGVAAVAVGCGIVWLASAVRRALAARGPAQAAATAYLDALVAGDVAVAYGMLTADQRERTDPAEYAERHGGERALTGYTIDGTTVVTGGGFRAEVRGQVRLAAGDSAPLSMRLLPEADGRWRVADWRTGPHW
ncbi:hypothetical protein [Micromonospora costi]|uniref:DUF4878 domain-containing protein n=1 Tax=Micromonospora costi TaxID=1530042 RepID=A0A3B0AAC3_9ACTN|nr:hypothetical protein [Micromonospora costi]RKN57572.1 hypothetical protein D7193_02590 [Micromonospora costi]